MIIYIIKINNKINRAFIFFTAFTPHFCIRRNIFPYRERENFRKTCKINCRPNNELKWRLVR